MAAWYEDEAFWEASYPFMFPQESFESAEAQVGHILKLLPFEPVSVLDLCCGPGRHAIPLARMGLNVTGVDRSSFLLEKAKARADAENLTVEWAEQDMREFVRSGSFDLVLNLFTSFGFFEDEAENRKVLQSAQASLRPGGALVIDVLGKECLARTFQPTRSQAGEDGTLVVHRAEVREGWSRVRVDWILLKDNKSRTFTFEHSIYSGQELKGYLHDSGFERVSLFADWEGNEYGPDAKRLIAVAFKPD